MSDKWGEREAVEEAAKGRMIEFFERELVKATENTKLSSEIILECHNRAYCNLYFKEKHARTT